MKSMNTKNLAYAVVALTLATALGACSASKAGNANGASTNGTDTNKPITLTYFSADPSPNWNEMQDEVGKIITEKTGITIKAEFAIGGPTQQVALIAASGNYPDLISPKGDLSKLVDAGAMIDLTSLIEKYGPNVTKVYGKYMKRLRYSEKDHSIYVLPTYAAVGQENWVAGGGFELQNAVVEALGYPRIRTVKDFEKAIQEYKQMHPTINGRPTIGLSLNADDWHMYISVTNPAFFATGAPDDGEFYIDPKTYEATYHYLRPPEKEYFRWLNHMNDVGLLDPETFVQKSDQYNSKIASGRVLGLIDQNWDYADGENALKAAGEFNRTYGHYPVTLTTEYKDHSFQPTGFLAGWGIGITKACKYPARAMELFNYLSSDQGQVLMNWGVKGKDYILENGKRVIPAAVQEEKTNQASSFQRRTGIGLYNLMAPHYGDGVKDPTGNYYTTSFPEQIMAGYNSVEKNVLAHYHATMWKDLFPPATDFPVKPWGAAWNISTPSDAQVSILENKMKDITWYYIPRAILAEPSNFDAVWAQYMRKLKDAGVAKMDKEYTNYVQARVRLWNN